MLFWLIVIVLIIGIVTLVLGCKSWDYEKNKFSDFIYDHDEGLMYTGGAIILIDGIFLTIAIAYMCCNFIGINAKVEQYKEKYNAITYKVESGACRDDFGLLNKEVIDEIQDWNENITYNKNIERDFWIGVFYPNVYDEFETISYEKYSRE